MSQQPPWPGASKPSDSFAPLTRPRPAGFVIYVAASPARSVQRVKLSTPRRSFSQEFLTPLGTQDFHLRFEPDHARRDSFIFFGDAGDRSRYRALIDQALKLFIRTQAQHFFAATGSVSFPKIKQDDFEQRLEFERGLGGKHGHQLFGN